MHCYSVQTATRVVNYSVPSYLSVASVVLCCQEVGMKRVDLHEIRILEVHLPGLKNSPHLCVHYLFIRL